MIVPRDGRLLDILANNMYGTRMSEDETNEKHFQLF
jgi:hypothetical protein